MISCKLQGGLGNQMFQIATAHALALRNDDKSCFTLDSCHTPNQGFTASKYKDNVLSKVLNVPNFVPSKTYLENGFSYSEIPYGENLMLYGYFQSWKYFKDCKDIIVKLFQMDTTNAKPYIDKVKKDWAGRTITSLHIRRGDYLSKQAYHKPCTIKYYLDAMETITNSTIIVISDDKEWASENIKGHSVIYSPFTDEVDDLALMSECDNNIIANSSFSWWGAYLNKNPYKKVIAPKEWFGPDGPKDTQDLYPENWYKI